MAATIGTMMDKLKTYIDDFLSQSEQKEKEYTSLCHILKNENEKLHIMVADLEQELQFMTKRMEEMIMEKTSLQIEVEELKRENATTRRWKFF